ncbi:MAG: hypothetical protein K2I77_07270 [Anaeroplasmataceae bacterium]|nr:hypothetical protein [Anaeroplasmataceae bacterium]
MICLGILFGGKSFEHEISIVTAYQLKKRLSNNYKIHMIYISLDGDFYLADQMQMKDFRLENFKKLKKLKLNKLHLDVLVGAMHGENGEDGLAACFAKINHLKYLGCDVFAASTAMDKYRSFLFLNSNGVEMVPTTYYSYQDYLDNQPLPYLPCILKPTKGGSSLGIEVVLEEDDAADKLSKAFHYTEELIIQPYYNDLEEFNLALNETEFSNLEKIHKKDSIFSFDNKYSDSFKVMHQSLIEDSSYPDFCKVARRVYDLLDARGIIRIDFFKINDVIYVNEVNTTPGALAMYLFPDFDAVFKESLDRVIKEQDRKYPNTHYLLKNNINK